VLTLGIDLAARPKTTAACLLEWSRRRDLVLVESARGLDDDALLDLARRADYVGIDCPFGWPDAFVDRIGAHHRFEPLSGSGSDPDLRLRRTDRVVHGLIGRAPLSVSTDRIGTVALRCIGLLEALGGPELDRSGLAGVAETYPGGALTCWGIDHRGYKRPGDAAAGRRAAIAGSLTDGLGVSVVVPTLTDDDLDSFICALLARAVALGQTTPIPDPEVDRARREGWIHLPTGPLADLVQQ
jgi:predicted nuclease with RNAse H fold